MNRLRLGPASPLQRPRRFPALVGPDRPRRLYSSEPPSAHAAFYKTFGRPIAKVTLTAIFTYQLVYYAWLRLEHNEVKVDLNATIAELEGRVAELEGAQASKKP